MTIVPLVDMYVKSSACTSVNTVSNNNTQPQPQHRLSHALSLFVCANILTEIQSRLTIEMSDSRRAGALGRKAGPPIPVRQRAEKGRGCSAPWTRYARDCLSF